MIWKPNDDGRPSPRRLYRDPQEGMMLGVCAGVAEYFGLNPWIVRVLTVIALITFTPPVLIGYLLMAVLLPKKPLDLYESAEEEAFWRDVRVDPHGTFSEVRHRYRDLEQRLRGIESYVTSDAYRVSKEISDLERSG